MQTVKELIATKGAAVWSIPPTATVLEALKKMAEKGIGALLVAERGIPMGLFSEREYARKVALFDRSSRRTQVREIMVRHPVCVGPEQSLQECMELMTEHRVRHLPVVAENRVVGLVSIGDLLKVAIETLREEAVAD